ncbi:MAG: hypothetical protein ABI406_02245 [Ktedonobacteraceae bacterium]
MKRKLLLVFGPVILALAAVMMILPMQTMAATDVSAKHHQHHQPHFFFKKGYHGPGIYASGGNLNYGGGPVMGGTVNVYDIFWEPTGNVSPNYNSLIERYFNDVNGSGLYQNNTQYTDSNGGVPSNETLAATWVDNSAYPESPLLDSDIQNEVSNAQNANGWSSSNDNIFFVFLEANQNLCFDSSQSQCASNAFCAYHSYFGTNTIYAAMPYAASFSCNPGSSPNHNDADQTINVTSHEQMESATDPLLDAWFDSSGNEIGDKCAWNFGSRNSSGADVTWNGHGYILQKEWDNHRRGCVLSGP